MVALIDLKPASTVAVLSVGAIPLILWGSYAVPALVVGTITYSQILEGFQLQTPIGTISLGIVSLLLFLTPRLSQIATRLITMNRIGIVCLAAYVGGQSVQFLHNDPGIAARQMITASSFAAFGLMGIHLGARRNYLPAAAAGATAGLWTLATLALAANLGLFAALPINVGGRDILGLVSPFFRSYGLEGVTVALLLAVAVPWLALNIRSPGEVWSRPVAAVAVVSIWLASLLLFQSRSMVLEIPLGCALLWSLAGRRFSTAVILVMSSSAAALLAGLLLSAATDPVSNQLRGESYATALGFLIQNPAVLLTGTNTDQFRMMVNTSLTYTDLIPAFAPTHNLLIETVVTGGLVSATGLVLFAVSPVIRILHIARRMGRFSNEMAIALTGLVLAVIEASVTPVVANSAPFWIALGYAHYVAAGGPPGINRLTAPVPAAQDGQVAGIRPTSSRPPRPRSAK